MDEFKIMHRGTESVISVFGEVDISNVEFFRSTLSQVQPAATNVIVDLTNSTFIDSSMVSALSKEFSRTKRDGAGFELVCPSSNQAVWRVIDLMGLSQIMKVRETLSDEA